MIFSETTYFIAGGTGRMSIALCTHPTEGYCEATLTVYPPDVEKKTKSKFRSSSGSADIEVKRCTLQQKTVRHSTLVKIVDYEPDLRMWLRDELRNFGTWISPELAGRLLTELPALMNKFAEKTGVYERKCGAPRQQSITDAPKKKTPMNWIRRFRYPNFFIFIFVTTYLTRFTRIIL
jgi:hypothetical protein